MSHHCPFCGSMEKRGVYDNASFCSKISNLNPCDPCKRLAELDIQIIKARETLLEMRREARRLKSEMNFSHDHLIHQLPPEISSYIFQLCIPREMNRKARRAPVALIPFGAGWIDRSGRLPLSIGLFAKSHHDWAYTINPDVIGVINQCSSRWRDLTYCGPSSLLSYLVGDLQGAAQLQTLTLQVDWTESAGQFKLGDFKPTPTTLEIRGLGPKSVVIEWNNITHMQAGNISVDDCWELFRIAPRMTHCVLQGLLRAHDRFPTPHTLILHAMLQVLELSIDDVFHLFLNNISLPFLKSFTGNAHGRHLESESLISLFSRSSCSLQTLALTHYYKSGPDVMEHIFCRFSNAFIITSTNSETNQAFFPQLQSMTFKGAMPLDWTLVPDIFGSPSDVYNFRRRPLRSLTLRQVDRHPKDDPIIIDKDSLSRMLLLIKEGIKLKIKGIYPRIDILQQSIEFHVRDSALRESLGPTSNSSSEGVGKEL
ncbi:hypothetical protein BDZ97DRAFT_2071102 [Flammula alnicola]|nr:hypothetical protein BDZ97DRAFT_2071102 [Flammula alnicola]